MRFIPYNIVPICLLALAAFMVWIKTDGWGWCVFGAIITSVTPTGSNKSKSKITLIKDDNETTSKLPGVNVSDVKPSNPQFINEGK